MARDEGVADAVGFAARWQRFTSRHEDEITAASVHVAAKIAMVVLVMWAFGRPEDFFDRLALAWDGEHFRARANEGYHRPEHFAFAPLYPWLVRMLGGSVGALLFVSNIASIAAVVLVTRLMGLRAGIFLGVFPLWLVFSTVGYSEAVFVLLAAGALLVVRDARGWQHGVMAGLLAGLAVLARYAGVFGFAGAGLWLLGRRAAAIGFAATGGVMGGALLMWHQRAGGSARVYLQAQEHWGAELAWPWEQVDWILHGWFTNQAAILATAHPSLFLWRNAVVWVVAVVGVWRLWKGGHRLLLAYSAPLVILVASTIGTPAISLPRLVLAAFPAIAVHGAMLRSRDGILLYFIVSTLLGAWVLSQHINGQFFA